MHKEFQDKFKELGISFATIESKIGCPKNYLSRFINGSFELPAKWETKIRGYLSDFKAISIPQIDLKHLTDEQLLSIPEYIQLSDRHSSLSGKLADLEAKYEPIASLCQKNDVTVEDVVRWYNCPVVAKNGPATAGSTDYPPGWETMGKIERLKWLTANKR